MNTDRLVQFVNDRLDERELAARKATQGRWFWADHSDDLDPQGSGELMADGGEWRACPHFCRWDGEENLHRGTPGVPGHEHRVAEIVVGSWGRDANMVVVGEADKAHIAYWDPARVLADVAAKRAILAEIASWEHDATPDDYGMERCDLASPSVVADDTCTCGLDERSARILLLLAAPFADHPDCDVMWKP